jgi:starch synthase
MYSLLYGTLPIVRRTGGLVDTVQNYDESSGKGTGFMFDDLTPQSVYNTTGWAVWAWYNRPKHILEMRKRGMAQDFSWDISAQKYIELYHDAGVKNCDVGGKKTDTVAKPSVAGAKKPVTGTKKN